LRWIKQNRGLYLDWLIKLSIDPSTQFSNTFSIYCSLFIWQKRGTNKDAYTNLNTYVTLCDHSYVSALLITEPNRRISDYSYLVSSNYTISYIYLVLTEIQLHKGLYYITICMLLLIKTFVEKYLIPSISSFDLKTNTHSVDVLKIELNKQLRTESIINYFLMFVS
jgi:hypothetical protein